MAWRASMERLTLAGEREFYESAVSIFIRKGWERMGIPPPGVLFRSGPDVMIRFAEAWYFWLRFAKGENGGCMIVFVKTKLSI